MKYFSMFSGIGGFELGIRKSISDWECIGYSEVNKYAIQIYEKHFTHKNYGDATRIDPNELPDFDLLCGGFPCQAFSIAGKRGGFKDTRGTLFFEIARILSVKRPQLLLLENVKGLLSHDHGRTFGTILTALSELGYFCEWQVLNSKDFGVPQNRERVFIVGHLGESGGRKVFPIGSQHEKDFDEVAMTLLARDYKGVGNQPMTLIEQTKNQSQGGRVYKPEGISQAISSGGGGLGAKTGLYAIPTMYGQRIRRLTPTECERLQGFPDGWTAGISDSQRYKVLGNAVTVNVIEAIASCLTAQQEEK